MAVQPSAIPAFWHATLSGQRPAHTSFQFPTTVGISTLTCSIPRTNTITTGSCRDLDAAPAALLTDLVATKGRDGRTLLDKTFIVCMGEFGRTGGDLKPSIKVGITIDRHSVRFSPAPACEAGVRSGSPTRTVSRC
jgi:hypothetical protein